MNIRLEISGSEKIRVLAMIADAHDRAVLQGIATRESWRLHLVDSRETVLDELKRHPAVVLCDRDWRMTLDAMRPCALRSRMILAAPATDDKLWLEVLGRGGYDVVTRPFHSRRLIDAIALAWRDITK